MASIQRVTAPTVTILRALLASPEPIWGLQLVKATGLKTGSVYPILGRLEDAGLIEGRWEEDESRGGARRRVYMPTEAGATQGAEMIAAFDAKKGSAPST